MTDAPASFDPQADTFDRRAGLPPGVAPLVARAIEALVDSRFDGDGHREGGGAAGEDAVPTILEVGSGTGEIGIELGSGSAGAGPLRYVGFDLSRRMAILFRRRLAERVGPRPSGRSTADSKAKERRILAVADGGRAWPLRDGTVDAIFGSRSLHLLDAQHVVDECERVARGSNAVLLTGRVERSDDSLRDVMRRKMRERLREHGLAARSGGRHRDALLRICEERGGKRIEAVTAAEWAVEATPREAIESWRRTGGLGGRSPSADVKEAILAELARFAELEYDGLDTVVRSNERYRIEGARIASPRAEGRA